MFLDIHNTMASKISNVSKKKPQPQPLNPFKVYHELNLSVDKVMCWHLTAILVGANSKMRAHESFRDPWQLKIVPVVMFDLFWQMYGMFKDLPHSYGVRMRRFNYKRKRDPPRYLVIDITCKARLSELLSQFGVEEPTQYFSKNLPKGSKACLTVSPKKVYNVVHCSKPYINGDGSLRGSERS